MPPEALSLVSESSGGGGVVRRSRLLGETCFIFGGLYFLQVGLGALPYERVPGPNSNVYTWGFPHTDRQFSDTSTWI